MLTKPIDPAAQQYCKTLRQDKKHKRSDSGAGFKQTSRLAKLNWKIKQRRHIHHSLQTSVLVQPLPAVPATVVHTWLSCALKDYWLHSLSVLSSHINMTALLACL